MRKYFLIIVTIIFLMLSAFEAFAATPLFSVGDSNDDNLVEISSTGILSGHRTSYEVFPTTGDTLTADESGKTIIFIEPRGSSTGNTNAGGRFSLPSASLGLEFTFVLGSNAFINVDPAYGTSDRIIYTALVQSGDSLTSAGATGDSLKLICGFANTWYVSGMRGTWTDGDGY
jgi:hypothetical protein